VVEETSDDQEEHVAGKQGIYLDRQKQNTLNIRIKSTLTTKHKTVKQFSKHVKKHLPNNH
jgi:hypothetical protein